MKKLFKISLLLLLSLAFISCDLLIPTNEASNSNNNSHSNDAATPTILRGTWTNYNLTQSITITEDNVIYKDYTVDNDIQTLVKVNNYKEDDNYSTVFGAVGDMYYMNITGIVNGRFTESIYTYYLDSSGSFLRVNFQTWSGGGGGTPYYPEGYDFN